MRQGFKWGAMSGSVLGVVFGIIPAVKHRQLSILIASVLFTGGMFSCIGCFGSLIHTR